MNPCFACAYVREVGTRTLKTSLFSVMHAPLSAATQEEELASLGVTALTHESIVDWVSQQSAERDVGYIV